MVFQYSPPELLGVLLLVAVGVMVLGFITMIPVAIRSRRSKGTSRLIALPTSIICLGLVACAAVLVTLGQNGSAREEAFIEQINEAYGVTFTNREASCLLDDADGKLTNSRRGPICDARLGRPFSHLEEKNGENFAMVILAQEKDDSWSIQAESGSGKFIGLQDVETESWEEFFGEQKV